MTHAAFSAARITCFALALLPLGCGGDEAAPRLQDAGPTGCAPGERLVDGKGCLAAGIQDNGCPAGTLGLDDGTCQPAGIPPELCGEGFEPDGNMGCNAILPAEPCPKGLMAVPGETTCREVAPCGAGPWGDIPVEANTEHVDAAYAGIDSDGSQAKPWKTIQDGVDAAEPDAIVGVAAGSYEEDVDIQGKAVRLWGRCSKLVEIVGTAAGFAAVFIEAGASGAEVRGVALRGPMMGLLMSGSESVLVDQVWIHDAGFRGLAVENAFGKTSVELKRSLLEGNRDLGVFVSRSVATIEATVVRDTQPASDEQFGRGIDIVDDSTAPASLTVRASVIDGNRGVGVNVAGADTTIEATVVRDTEPRAADEKGGSGINIHHDPVTGQRATGIVRSSIVEGNHEVGLLVTSSDVTIEATIVRDTKPQLAGMWGGAGIGIQVDPVTAERASVTVRTSIVEGNHETGVLVDGSEATLESTVVRHTQPPESTQLGGRGITIQDHPVTGQRASAVVRACLIEDNRDVGVMVFASDATIEATIVRDTQPQAFDGRFGDGVSIDAAWDLGASATLTACLIAGNARAGVASFGATVGLAQTSLDCNLFHLAGENPYPGTSFWFDELGDNACGCGEETAVCQVESPGLEPPEALPPLE